MLLAKRGEDKIRIRNRQKVPLRLSPLIRPFSPNPASPNSNQRLPNLITRSPRIRIRIDKSIDSSLLIRLQVLSALHRDPTNQCNSKHNQSNLSEPNTPQEQPAN